jgi:hypothetical protein
MRDGMDRADKDRREKKAEGKAHYSEKNGPDKPKEKTRTRSNGLRRLDRKVDGSIRR